MSNYNNLKTAIDANIKQNGNQEITGPILNSVLNQMVNILGTGYQFAGVATLDPATNPGTPDAKVFYIANGKGTYTYFGGLEVTEDEVVILYWDSAWHKVATGIASQAKLSELEKDVATKQDIIPDLDSIRAGAALGASALQEETDPSVPSWAKEATKPSYTPEEVGAASEEALQSHVNDNTRHITDTERAEWSAKQDAITLTIKDNGNIVLANIQGQSKEFMPATPSGDPMHYAYEKAGAVWNDTGADIIRIGRMTGDTIVHKSGYWYLNELGDISNEEMRAILIQGRNSDCLNCQTSSVATSLPLRTNLFPLRQPTSINWLNVEVVVLLGNPEVLDYTALPQKSPYETIYSNQFVCRKILTIIDSTMFSIKKEYTMRRLEFFKLKNMALSQYIDSPYFREDCILYMIQNEAATSAITITLHADAYARAMANADILAALEAHPNVSLASA